MSNPVTFTKTIFVNPKDKTESYGYRMFDIYDSIFCDQLEKELFEKPAIDILRSMVDSFTPAERDMFESAIDKGGIMVDGEFVELVLKKNDEDEILFIGGEQVFFE